MVHCARVSLEDVRLDQLHALKRRLARERGVKLTLDELLGEAVEMLLRYHGHPEASEAGGAR